MSEAGDGALEYVRSRVGTVLRGKWRLERLIGAGGMAAVYAAKHRNGAQAAVKMLHPEVAVTATGKKRFITEGYAANAVGHAGVVKVLDDDVAEDGSVFIVMELLEGESLEARWRRLGPLPASDVLHVAERVLAPRTGSVSLRHRF